MNLLYLAKSLRRAEPVKQTLIARACGIFARFRNYHQVRLSVCPSHRWPARSTHLLCIHLI